MAGWLKHLAVEQLIQRATAGIGCLQGPGRRLSFCGDRVIISGLGLPANSSVDYKPMGEKSIESSWSFAGGTEHENRGGLYWHGSWDTDSSDLPALLYRPIFKSASSGCGQSSRMR